jgi:hypothetical protein
MKTSRKVTIHISDELLERALEATGEGLTPTIRRGLELIAAATAYEQVRKLRRKVRLSIKLKELREDRR